ncbi:MAG: glycosyltransferase family 2 protein [Candidatus Azambacteria bacterium]|nr:glycosyltransferase family 2 protein [Candidatus Azambacteria bacterium]
MNKVSCIIPAHNEEKNIRNVLNVVSGVSSEFISEIIVVDDGSIDNTPNIVREFPNIRLIINEKNSGKSYSIAKGIQESSGDFILMLDADLHGLLPEDIVSLVDPVKSGKASVSMSVRKNAPIWMKLIKVDLMTGERVFPKNIIMPYMREVMALRGYALEVFINGIIIKNKCAIKSVYLKNVQDELKTTKKGLSAGIKLFLSMWRDILKTVSFWEWLYQNFALSKLVIRD